MQRLWKDRGTILAAGRILVPIAGLLGITVVLTGTLMQRATERANTLEAERASLRLEHAVAERAGKISYRLRDALGSASKLVAPPEVVRGLWLNDGLLVDAGSLVALAATPISAPVVADLVAGRRGAAVPHGPGESGHRLLWGNTRRAILIVVVAAAGDDGLAGPVPAAIGAEVLDPARLAAETGDETLRSAEVSTTPPGTEVAAMPLLDPLGRPRAWLTWSPSRPGDVISRNGRDEFILAMLVLMVVSGFVFEYVRHVAFDLARREASAKRQAGHDPLSGLANRKLYEERVDAEVGRLARGGEGMAVMLLDLDRFKDVNDSYGHEAGDELIRTVSARLSDLLRGADTAARIGGDEFAVLQVGVRSPRDAEGLARRILEEVRRPVDVDGAQITSGASIGIALAPLNGTSRQELMRLADLALYRAKHSGRNRFAFFTEGMDEELRLREAVEHDLRRAIEADELNVLYQPIVNADGTVMLGAEALVRWNHPRFGSLSPASFVPLAEERGLMGALGEWVLTRALRDAAGWGTLPVSVNVSPVQFRHPGFYAGVERIVRASGIDPSRLELELTEGVVVEKADEAEEVMLELRGLGVRLALDDFGVGYSSLIYLRRFAFDKIKIDRSFLLALEPSGESAVLVQSMVHLGRALGLTVCAEGIETEEQRVLIHATGCHQMQGFLFSPAVPATEISRRLASQARRDELAA